jgi:hypothetical protein
MRTAKYHVAPLLAAVLASGPVLRFAGAAIPESRAISEIGGGNFVFAGAAFVDVCVGCRTQELRVQTSKDPDSLHSK